MTVSPSTDKLSISLTRKLSFVANIYYLHVQDISAFPENNDSV